MTSKSTSEVPAFLRQSRGDLHSKFVDLEWKQRNRLAQGSQDAATSGDSKFARLAGDHITSRNRYLNVEPFAQNRIKLKVGEGVNDYINASPIKLGERYYIATQGPKDTSVTHFYRMLKSEIKGPAVVVMLTQTFESGKEKCFQYYPLTKQDSPLDVPRDEESGDGFTGTVELISTEEASTSRTQIRKLKLHTKTDDGSTEEKDITHLLFSGWPDFLVPEGENRTALIRLVQLSARFNAGHSTPTDAPTTDDAMSKDLSGTEQDNPRIIHCSAGVGRSGTFIALDYLLGQLHSGKFDRLPANRDPVAETVDSLRQQRMMMVQGESQFNFLYEVLREQFEARQQSKQTAA
ncbi:hypothetical protein AMS68_006321 [Peltaster fructicola]|uniref:Tyrosine specific protein phosphatases domain-containing protein n=1 Tax=Peltaster fructicola TaxID=286661 RepID=A0A6H0Y1B7_9PEZI|nr:hypothetical protein AMS68_006321 [Peltaster fructicola]